MRARLAGLVLAILTISAVPTWIGTPYEILSCSQYVAKQSGRPHLWANKLWTVPAGYELRGQFANFGEMTIAPAEGDIAAFHGVHVAIFHSGVWMDSDPKHSGVGRMNYNPADPWFTGQVRIIRYRR